MPIPTRTLSLALAAALAAALTMGDIRAAPLSSAFTYQGELYDTGQPLVGSVDLRFTPYADLSNPTLLGPPVVVEDVVVSEGVFTAKVDFGPGFFVGDAVFLEVAVRPFDSVDLNAFEALNPRQEITAAPYTLKPAPGSVTDIELAGDAVGATQIADGAVASADIGDGSVAPQDLNLAGFDSTFWRVGGNTGAGGAALGTLDSQPLSLVSPVGVTINGPRFNDNTEITIRGNPIVLDNNADLSLWPRGGEAFFNIAAIPNPSTSIATPANTSLVISSVGTNPFTGFVSRLSMGFDGALRQSGGAATPPPRLEITRNFIGFDAPADSTEAQELVLTDSDAQLGLYSLNDGSAGSVITLGELAADAFTNAWGIYRATTVAGSAMRFTFGTNSAAAANPALFHFGTNASLGVGGAPFNGELEMYLTPSPVNTDNGVDIAMQPRGGNHSFDMGVKGTDETDTNFALYFAGPTANFEPRMRVTGTGSFAAGKRFTLAHGGSFVFADDSTTAPVATTAANQFLVRATGGVAVNGAPDANVSELTVRSRESAIGTSADIAMYPAAAGRAYRISVGGTAGSMIFYGLDPVAADPISVRMLLSNDGDLAINPAVPGGGFQANGFPLRVGTTGTTTNGNGAHVTNGGVWTNGSSRTFKEAFTAIDAGDILSRVLAMPITRWRYRGGENAWHLGPMAEDFFAAFGLGGEEKYIGTVDADGVALAAIQGLNARVEARAKLLERENAALRTSLATLAERVAALERGD